MSEDYVLEVTRQALYLVLLISAPAVLASLAIGLLVSLFQATTQLQDQTLTFVPKLVMVLVVLAVAGGWMGANLMRFARALFLGISAFG
ncbi:MAG: flagellar biosynthetic protein FliQ [Proteobacteria bacterium]|nr:MAG: flagellar biosynthetic protein FliQ [Pseudomonadota bacterium]PIE17833.1 MAG: flagellar biosynthetic protein FliQ [Pseudomonadota bacterium]